jgi:CRISPR system Cascade subunit CasE
MLLHRIHLNPRCREARRDLSDPYQMHSTLCRAFAMPDQNCPEGEFLWRLEPEAGPDNLPRVLVQSRSQADWTRISLSDWLAQVEPAIDLRDRLKLDSLQAGQRFQFRLRANPCVTRNHKRLGLLRLADQEAWVVRKGELHGFMVPRLATSSRPEAPEVRFDVRVSQEQMLRGKQHAGNGIRVYAVLFDGLLTVTDPEKFRLALDTGIGHGKAMGLGLLSVVPTA